MVRGEWEHVIGMGHLRQDNKGFCMQKDGANHLVYLWVSAPKERRWCQNQNFLSVCLSVCLSACLPLDFNLPLWWWMYRDGICGVDLSPARAVCRRNRIERLPGLHEENVCGCGV